MSALGPYYVLMCRFENEATGLRSAGATGIGEAYKVTFSLRFKTCDTTCVGKKVPLHFSL